MRHACIFRSASLVWLTLVPVAHATTLYVSPTGTDTTTCTRDAPCALGTAANNADAGDTVILLDGVYKSQLWVKNTGTSSAWITFQADECATPIIEGKGIETDTDQPMGVGSNTANYVRFVGIVARGWNIGFGNGWIKDTAATISNGHIEYKYCIAQGNGRTGFTFFSAEGIHIQNCISAHNGSSVAHSWSSGISLFEAQGSGNLVEGSVAFENTDAQQHTDGSGFIADEHSNGASFVNNVAFRNGGSCMRVTVSSDVKFINNTCYHNAQDLLATGPDNPSEIYVTDEGSRSGMVVKNNTFYSTGNGPGAKAVFGQAVTGWSNNAVQDGGNVTVFTAPDGTNPDFTLASSASSLTGKGAAGNGAPTTDIGFDPKCITKKAPTMIGDYTKADWWQYSVDIDYIKSIGGVARCFRPRTRSGTPDIGAYANGGVTALTDTCTRSTGGAPSNGGASSAGGATANGGTSTGNGGTSSKGGTTNESGGTS
ncbi:MAG TPA: right-handed parallel beta-helix repeat-containing protein, partial [Polyangiaceae bacterium]